MKNYRKILGLALSVVLSASLLASCGEKKPEEMTAEEYAAMSVDELIAQTVGEEKEITNESYIKLFSTIRFAEMEENLTVPFDNKTKEAIDKLEDDETITLPATTSPEILNVLLADESALVRGEAVEQMSGSLLGTTEEHQKIVTDLIAKEKDPYVLKKILIAFSNDASNPEIGQFMLKMAENENKYVRCSAAQALANSWSKNLEGALDTVIKLMNDKDDDVRKLALSGGGKLGDEKVIDTVVAILNNPDDYKVHGDAAKCLSTLWLDFPFHDQTSERAYRATLDYYTNSTKSKNVPQWTAFSAISTITTDEKTWNEWLANATYYNQDELANALMAVITSPDADKLARTTAIQALATHTTPEKYMSFKATIDGLTDENASSVQSSFEQNQK